MPSYGEKQKPAGVKLKTPERCKPVGKRSMKSKDSTIQTAMTIDNIPYKGNATLLANK
tara:strand:+ start:327 stop:500 length:174 start_codon:yes stop_codon:yes gene_type:complete